MTEAPHDTPPPPEAPKAQPETLTLRAAPRRIVRFRRGVVIGGAAAGSLAIAGVAWMALAPQVSRVPAEADEPAVSARRAPPDAVAGLPPDYSRVTPTTPMLGPPLPGDLGRPIVRRQRELGIDPADPGGAAPAMTPEEQVAAEERRRIAAQASQAREAGVMVQLPGRTGSAVPSAAGEAIAGLMEGAAVPASGAEAAPSIEPARDPNHQGRKLDFLNQTPTGATRNSHALQLPRSPHQVMAGSVIAASLLTGVNSDLPGLVTAQVTENVYDTVTGRTLLIPQGSRLIGAYDSVVAFGQSRALLAWQRIILPDGSSIQIDNLPATDAAGYAGLEDRVDFHTWRLLRGIALSTLLGVGTELSLGDSESDLIRAIRESTQQNADRAGQQIVTRNLDIQPTIRIRPGWPLRVIVHKDLALRPWVDAARR